MNYYQRYMGDYQGKTQALSLAEHGAYTMLLDIYYLTEKPLPADLKSLYRLCRAMDKNEQEAVRRVSESFFYIGEDGHLHNDRADDEIERARPRMEASSSNGKKGGRPRKEKHVLGSETETKNNENEKPTGFFLGSETETQAEPNSKAPHAPYIKPPNPLAGSKGEAAGAIAALEDLPAAKPPAPPPCDHDGVIAAYHAILPELPRVAVWGKERERKLAARWRSDKRHQSLDFWRWFFESARSNPHWLGQNDRGWRPDLEWFLSPSNFARVIERGIENNIARAA